MKKRITSLTVIQTGKLLAVLYGFLSLLMIPFLLIGMLSGDAEAVVPMLIIVVLYPIMGFVGGILMAVIYNFAANWVGGLEFTVEPSDAS